MSVAELRTEHMLPEWTVGFLRDRCKALQQSLVNPGTVISLHDEEDSIHCWRLLLIAGSELPHHQLVPLDELHLLHAQIAERLERGGVADISADVEFLMRTILIDRLQRLTDVAVEAVED